jgi:hypothetical protein
VAQISYEYQRSVPEKARGDKMYICLIEAFTFTTGMSHISKVLGFVV